MSTDPLILTLRLDPAATAWFDSLRLRYFPAERLRVGAHVTLLHALPGELERDARGAIEAECSGRNAFRVEVTGLRLLGRSVAFALAAPEANALRQALAGRFAGYLTPQDRQRWEPHVTIQNKVGPETALRTMAELAGESPPERIMAEGVALWRYRGGPWERVSEIAFSR